MKRNLAFGLLLLALGAIGYFGVRIYQDIAAERAAQKRVQTLPKFSLVDLQGGSFQPGDLAGEQPAVLMFFHPSCPYCQHEARSIRAHDRLLNAADVLMISSRPRGDLQAFADSFRLANHPQIRVLRDSAGAVTRSFGVDKVPKTFLYDKDGSLLRQFEAEVGASKLYSVLTNRSSLVSESSDS